MPQGHNFLLGQCFENAHQGSSGGRGHGSREQGLDRMTIEILDANLLEPAGLHDAGDAGRIVAITLIDLHLEYSLRCIDADHRQAQPLELGP
jgi:hypothetical protein